MRSSKPLVVFDLDGVFVVNPTTHESNNDINFWHDHWRNWRLAKPQIEMVELAQDMQDSGHIVVVLTARPRQYRSVTLDLLARLGLDARPVPADLLPIFVKDDINLGLPSYPVPLNLVMIDSEQIVSSSVWKRDTIKSWVDAGLEIRFMVEDYKVNADVIREVVPVLLYERLKPT